MTEPEELEEDLFADLYDGDDAPAKPEAPVQQIVAPETVQAPTPIEFASFPSNDTQQPKTELAEPTDIAIVKDEPMYGNGQNGDTGSTWNVGHGGHSNQYNDGAMNHEPPPIGIKEDGKMFIGGLNWETTDESLKEYFSKFGEVQECTVMRDGASGRSRGFGFLTFRDPKTVNVVMVKEHYLDGKIVRPDVSTSLKAPQPFLKTPRPDYDTQCSPFSKIDPKRAIPRDEQERTSKIFVGGVSQDANEHVFKNYFAQFGRVVDATLMMDKDTGRPRGFGFVTFDSESAVDATLAGDLQILGKPIEVKKAQPRGNMREEENESLGRGGRGGGGRRGGKSFQDNDRGFDNDNNQQSQGSQNQQGGQGMMGGMTPQMMAQYWQKMQQYFATMQQQMASAAAMQNGGMGGMGAMNPQMMQQMQQMQQMQAMQAMQKQQQGMQQNGSQSPMPQSPGAGGMQGMTPAMMQQMQQMQQMQAQMQGGGGGGGGGGGFGGGPMGASPQPGMGGFGPGGPANGGGPRRGTPGYNAQDQLAFEQQKYEQQQARRAAQEAQQMGGFQGNPTSWEGMYDDVPQPNMGGGMGRGGGGGGRGGNRGSQAPTPGPQAAPPANAPTGPKNAGKPGANYRGGGSRGGHRGFHPYARNG